MVIFLMGDDILWTFQCLVSSYSSSSLFRSFFCTPDTISSSQTLPLDSFSTASSFFSVLSSFLRLVVNAHDDDDGHHGCWLWLMQPHDSWC